MPSQAKLNFDGNRKDVEQFWDIHERAVGSGPGRKHKVEVLNRAVIVFVCACWEAYVEDVLRDALNVMVSAAAPANLVADGLRRPLEHALGSFHRPDTRGVKNLFEGALGLVNLHKTWKWGKLTTNRATDLDALVKLRGRIAHRVTATTAIRKSDGTNALKLVQNLVTKTDAAVAAHLQTIVGTAPW